MQIKNIISALYHSGKRYNLLDILLFLGLAMLRRLDMKKEDENPYIRVIFKI